MTDHQPPASRPLRAITRPPPRTELTVTVGGLLWVSLAIALGLWFLGAETKQGAIQTAVVEACADEERPARCVEDLLEVVDD